MSKLRPYGPCTRVRLEHMRESTDDPKVHADIEAEIALRKQLRLQKKLDKAMLLEDLTIEGNLKKIEYEGKSHLVELNRLSLDLAMLHPDWSRAHIIAEAIDMLIEKHKKDEVAVRDLRYIANRRKMDTEDAKNPRARRGQKRNKGF